MSIAAFKNGEASINWDIFSLNVNILKGCDRPQINRNAFFLATLHSDQNGNLTLQKLKNC